MTAKESDDVPRKTRSESHREQVKKIRHTVAMSQRDRFIDAARNLGTDNDPEAFKERLKKMVKAPAQKPTKKPK